VKINMSSAAASSSLSLLCAALFEWFPQSVGPFAWIFIGPGLLGFWIAMILTPGTVHGNITPRLWTIGVLVNSLVFYLVIEMTRWGWRQLQARQ
jgi:hypothetical protein